MPALITGVLLLVATAAGAQTEASYRAAVESYRSGETDEAVKEAASWSTRTCIARRSGPSSEPAVT